MTDDPTARDLAEAGNALGEDGTNLFKTTLYALASSQSGAIGSEGCISFAAAQVYAEAYEDADTTAAREYVETFMAVYDLDSLADVNDLLGRQSFEQQNYEGQKAFA